MEMLILRIGLVSGYGFIRSDFGFERDGGTALVKKA